MAKTTRKPTKRSEANTANKKQTTTEKVDTHPASEPNPPSEARESRARTVRDQHKAEAQKRRANRIPYVGNASRLAVPQSIRDLYPSDNRYRWVNDEEGEVERRKQAGWEPVVDASGQVITRPVGRGKNVHSISALLMTIPYEFYTEDFNAQQKVNMAFHSSLKKGAEKIKDVGNVPGGTYAPNLDDGGRGFSETTSDRLIS